MSFPKRSVAAPCLCIKSGIIWTCDWCIPVVPHPNNRTCTHYTGDRRASNVRFCLGASGRKADIQIYALGKFGSLKSKRASGGGLSLLRHRDRYADGFVPGSQV